MGTTTFADAGNAFNMEVGDPISGYACWDDTQITGAGPETIQFGDPLIDDGVAFPQNKMQWTFGDIVLNHFNDTDWEDGGFPALKFEDGNVTGVDWLTDINENGAIADTDAILFTDVPAWKGTDMQDLSVEGTIGKWSTSPKPVPEPTTITLLGIGLVGLAGVALRSKWKKKIVDKS